MWYITPHGVMLFASPHDNTRPLWCSQDLVNSGLAGALASSTGALRTGNPALVLSSAVFGGALMVGIEAVTGRSKSLF